MYSTVFSKKKPKTEINNEIDERKTNIKYSRKKLFKY